FRDIENRTSKSSDMNYSSPTIGVRFNLPMGRFEEIVKPQNKAIFTYRPMRVLPPHGMFAAPWVLPPRKASTAPWNTQMAPTREGRGHCAKGLSQNTAQ
ncbi:hypothetical protein PMR94_09770, partial [Bifidobacterium longum]|nr:hypothetical protein [Bifidobacterium longum]MDB6756623.1 hypothetical protein [Bifidobacterium longum]MDB6758548.1 hypothetical protein [Bifidobacterium longum]MDB6760539.1 hypothetical protein [Bifidobacterium longum]MDB6762500.1 hypothetical protein [Bifidobacterium longum]